MTMPLEDETVLPTFAVLARFREVAGSADEAMRAVVRRMTTAEEPFHEVSVERQDPDGSWLVVVRFVLVSIDAQTAVVGLSETLQDAGMSPDEVWADGQVA